MLDSLLRPVKDNLIAPLADVVGRRFTPNAISAAAFAAGLTCAALLTFRLDAAALACWLLNRLLDGLDGLVARRSGRASDFGGYLDIVLDFMVYALIPLGMVFASPGLAVACALMLASFYVNSATWMYLAAVLEKRGRGAGSAATTVVMPAGLIEGTETIILYTLMILFPAYRPVFFAAAAALTFLGAALRFYQGARFLRSDRSS